MDQSNIQCGKREVQNEDNNRFITFVSGQTREEWRIDSRLVDFSQFLKHMFDGMIEDDPNSLKIQLPSFLKANRKLIDLISQFYSMHNYQKEGIKISKIKTNGWFHALDEVSLSFASKHLQPQSEDDLKRLLNISEYLKLNYLKEVICIFIASKHFYNYNEEKMKKQMEQRQIFLSRQMDINLKRGLLGYAKQFSKELIEKMKAMEQKRRNNNRV